ncbi:hypothetical protein HN51_018991 [Arachis hypogaea]
MPQVRQKTLAGLKNRMPELVRAMKDFSLECSKMYSELSMPADANTSTRALEMYGTPLLVWSRHVCVAVYKRWWPSLCITPSLCCPGTSMSFWLTLTSRC